MDSPIVHVLLLSLVKKLVASVHLSGNGPVINENIDYIGQGLGSLQLPVRRRQFAVTVLQLLVLSKSNRFQERV